jgi:hypothetical protein
MSGVICATLIDASPLKICGDLRVAVVFCAVDRGERRRRVLMIMRRGRVVWGTEKKPRHSTGASAREEKQSGRHVDSTHQQAPSKQVVPLLISQDLELIQAGELTSRLGFGNNSR